MNSIDKIASRKATQCVVTLVAIVSMEQCSGFQSSTGLIPQTHTDTTRTLCRRKMVFSGREEAVRKFRRDGDNDNNKLIRASVESTKQSQTLDIESNSLWEQLNEKIGSVSEERLIHPELGSREVPRLFSNIQYKRNTDDGTDNIGESKVMAMHAAGSTLGAAALVAGTTIGAGVLALPAATVSSGFLPSTGALILSWVYMTISGLLLAELSLNRIAETGRPGSGILDLYNRYLGENTRWLGSAAYFFLHYVVMTAYISQGGSNLASLMGAYGVSSQAGQTLFAVTSGSFLYLASQNQAEKVNNLLVFGVFATFLGLVACGVPTVNFAELVSSTHTHPENVLSAAPILFLSLVYQNIVPTVVNQLEGDRTKIMKAIIGGTFAPLIMFIMWNAIILGNVYGGDAANEIALATGSLNAVQLLEQSAAAAGEGAVAQQILPGLVSAFSELALITSLIGFVYGLVNAWSDVLKVTPSDENKWKPLLFGAALAPPLAVSLTNPDIFLDALNYGGAFGVSTLFLFLPPLMAWKSRYTDVDQPIATLPLVPFGKIPLGSLYKASATLIIEQGLEKLGVFEWVKEHVGLEWLNL